MADKNVTSGTITEKCAVSCRMGSADNRFREVFIKSAKNHIDILKITYLYKALNSVAVQPLPC